MRLIEPRDARRYPPAAVTVAPPTGNPQVDTANIAAAVATTTDYDTIQFRPGTYVVNATVSVPGRRTILGHGATIRAANGANLDAVVCSPAAVSVGASNTDGPIVIDGLTVHGNATSQTSGAGHGLWLASGGDDSGMRTALLDVCVHDTRGDGIILSEYSADGTTLGLNGQAPTAVEPRIERCRVFNVFGRGIWVQHSSSNRLTDGFCVGNLVGFCGLDGIRIGSSAGWQITGNHVYATGLSGILIQYAYATRMAENYVEGVGSLDASDHTSQVRTFRPCPVWSDATTYGYLQAVVHAATIYVSNLDGNVNNLPAPGGTDAWTPYVTGGASIAAIAAMSGVSGRPLHLADNQVSLGHSSWPLYTQFAYRGYLVQGPSSGSSRHTVYARDNDAVNESQPAGSNTVGFRWSPGSAGLRIVDPAGSNTARGAWTTLRDATGTPATDPAVSAGAAAGTTPTVSISGSDFAGSVTVTTGSSGVTAGTVATVTWSTARSAAARVALTPRTAEAAALAAYVTSTGSAIGIACAAAPATGATYTWDYIAAGV